ncbi:MAG: LarC family nickel insertion protein [Candidatus Gastranaerophilales bacterium]|nr:LarC family nickel insertion protein [Candidatus Gastranaerophilales bacterium]
MDLYFECKSGISGDMSVAALLDLGASREKLDKALASMKLDNEFNYEITKKSVNAIMATDFDVRLPNGDKPEDCSHHHEHHHEEHHHHHHEHRNLDDVNKIIDKADITENAKNLAKKIFKIVAEAEGKVHGKSIKDVHFHEVGAIDSIVDIVSFSVLFDDLKVNNVYFSTLYDGTGFVECQHGKIPVPVPAVCAITSTYGIPLRITENNGEMVTPTGAAIVAALYETYAGKKLDKAFIIEKIGYGAGKRPYENPILRVMSIKEKGE